MSVHEAASAFPVPRDDAPLVVFDFDHTLYDGDSGSHLLKWLIQRAWWRQLLAILAAPVAGPMVAFLPTRRAGISVFVWIGTIGLHRRRDLDALIDAYVAGHVDAIRSRLLPIALEVFRAHREAGDRVVDSGLRMESRGISVPPHAAVGSGHGTDADHAAHRRRHRADRSCRAQARTG